MNFVTWGAINGAALVAWIVCSPSTQGLAACPGMAVHVSCGGLQPHLVSRWKPGVLDTKRRGRCRLRAPGRRPSIVGQLDVTCHVDNGPHGGRHDMGGVGPRWSWDTSSTSCRFSQGHLGGVRSKMALVGVLGFVDGVRRPRGLGSIRPQPPIHILAVLKPSSVRRMRGGLHLLVRAARFRLGSA